jgi:hypothetical protein
MYTKINNVGIHYFLENGVRVRVEGPDNYYYVEIREYPKNSTESYYLEGYHLIKEPSSCYGVQVFQYDVKFYYDFELLVYKLDVNHGLVQIFHHRFDDREKLVLFNIDSHDLKEATLWYEKCLLYTDLHGCKPVIRTHFDELNHRNKNYFSTDVFEFYKVYSIGRYPKISQDFRSIGDQRVENTTWFGLWKKFWSYEHPREWKLLTSEEIVDDILGF